MPGSGQHKLRTVIDHDSGNHITLAANAMKQAQSLLQRPTTTPEMRASIQQDIDSFTQTQYPGVDFPPLTTEIKPDIIEEREEKKDEKTMDTITTPGGYEPGKADNLQENLKLSESSGRYDVVNKEGYMGAYQFGNARLTDYKKATNTEFSNSDFIKNKKLQDQVYTWHRQDIESSITKAGLNKYIGTSILDIPVTQEGLIAVAHLGGKTGMKKFLESNGKYNPADSNGTKLSDYLNKFKGNT